MKKTSIYNENAWTTLAFIIFGVESLTKRKKKNEESHDLLFNIIFVVLCIEIPFLGCFGGGAATIGAGAGSPLWKRLAKFLELICEKKDKTWYLLF